MFEDAQCQKACCTRRFHCPELVNKRAEKHTKKAL